ncbi:hypothetical protein MYXO_01128 [Myxococcaceae bacterium]|jgi:hypothetical protein|nr:hypothetical protein MYXO_01128 [Myxococcaceae bacterium]
MSDPEPSFFVRMAKAFVEEPLLWPVLAVIVLVGANFFAALLVLSIQDGSLLAAAGLLGVGALAFEALRAARSHGRLRVVASLLLAVALAGGLAAAAYLRLAA